MKNYKNNFLTLLFSIHLLHGTEQQQVVTFISPRSQGINLERILAGWEEIAHSPTNENFYSTYAIAAEVATSFRPERVNQCLFGEDVIRRNRNETEWKDSIRISGSHTENRLPNKDWLADYFGLPTDFQSTVRFRPRVNNYIVDTQLFFGLNNLRRGLFLQIEFPFIYTNSDLNIREAVTQPGTNNADPGYYNSNGIDRTNLLSCFKEFISGNNVPHADNLTFQPLMNAKMSCHSKRKMGFAELRATLGHDHYIKDIHHLGYGLHIAAPCGNRPRGEFLFEPMVGNGHHWELGVELSAHWLTWENPETDAKTELFFDAIITHLFTAHQRRSFDLKNTPNSRYMLAEKMSSTISNQLTGNGITPIAQYTSELAPIANFTTFDVNVSINVQANAAFMYTYTKKENSWAFGYSAWKRGDETIHFKNYGNFTENTWAIKGDAYVFGFVAEQPLPTDLPVGLAVPLSATESNATINTGTNFPSQGLSSDPAQQMIEITNAKRNPNIDSPQPAFAGNNQYLVASTNDLSITNQINTSIQPRFITWNDISINSAQTSGFSHKIFTHFNHKLRNNRPFDSYLGLGAEIEFGRQAGPTPAIGDDDSINCALSFWGVWLKGSVSF
jgi:hypothetical protein